MVKFNQNFKNLKKNYLFVDMRKKILEYKSCNPGADILNMGIGDVTLPLVPAIGEAMHTAVDEMLHKETFRGYGPHDGYDFLKNAISSKYKSRGIEISEEEIYISDGSKNDSANILDIFSVGSNVLVPDPAYPVYVDAGIMAGHKISYIEANENNFFLPMPSNNLKADIIYICSPNNPTGATYSKEQLTSWVNYANEHGSIIVFDSAYESFIEDESLPRSIFEIEGAKNCAIELYSFSKSAGFTGIRCAYTVIPKQLKFSDGCFVGEMWSRRQSSKFNGVSYITQKGALAALSREGEKQIKDCVNYYKKNALVLSQAMESLSIWHIGGKNSPYIWFKCPFEMKSWDFFDFLLEKFNIVGTPGSGFGSCGEGFFRLSSFATYENTVRATERLKNIYA